MAPLMIASLIASIAGAAMQHQAAQAAQARMAAQTRAAMERQRQFQEQAEQVARRTAATYEAPTRAAEQEQVSQGIEQTLKAPVAEAMAIRHAQTGTQGDVSEDYLRARVQSNLQATRQAEELARLLGRVSGANRMRMDESLRMADAGMEVDQLGGFARGQFGVDRMATDAAGRPNPGMMFLGSLLQAAGSTGMQLGGGGAGSAPTAGAGLRAPTGVPAGFDLAAPRAPGLRVPAGGGWWGA